MKLADLRVGVEYAYRYKNKTDPWALGKLRLLDTRKTAQRRSETNFGRGSKNIEALPAESWQEEYTNEFADGHVEVVPAHWGKTAVLPREILGPWEDYEEEHNSYQQAKADRQAQAAAAEAEKKGIIMAFTEHGFEVSVDYSGVQIDSKDVPELLRLLALAREVETV